MSDNPVIIETGNSSPHYCVIWLHGLGADGHDFAGIVEQMELPENLSIRFIFPHAPMQAVTINQGFVMRSWYDITNQVIFTEQDEKGIRESQQIVIRLIQQQIDAGISSENILLAGFSQGGVVALQTALRYPQKLAGIMALSTYLALDSSLNDEKSEINQNIPIFMAHGSEDPIIQIKYAYQSHSLLNKSSYKVNWNEYSGMPHSVCLEEISDINQWIIDCFSE